MSLLIKERTVVLVRNAERDSKNRGSDQKELIVLIFLFIFAAGYQYSDSTENPWKHPNKKNCDEIPNLAFKFFSKAGYSTMLNEDSATGGIFQYRMNGFETPPTDWYPRPFWIAAHESKNNCGKPPCVCETQQMIRMLKHYTRTCEDSLKFS